MALELSAPFGRPWQWPGHSSASVTMMGYLYSRADFVLNSRRSRGTWERRLLGRWPKHEASNVVGIGRCPGRGAPSLIQSQSLKFTVFHGIHVR